MSNQDTAEGPSEVAREVIALYKQDVPVTEITARTGMPRATIYWTLAKWKVPTRRAQDHDQPLATALVERLTEAEQEIGSLLTQLEEERRVNRYLLSHLAAGTTFDTDDGKQVVIAKAKRPAGRTRRAS